MKLLYRKMKDKKILPPLATNSGSIISFFKSFSFYSLI